MNLKDLTDLLYSNESLDRRFEKLEQTIKYEFSFDDTGFEQLLMILNELILKKSNIPNNYRDLLYLTTRFTTKQCLQLSELIKSDGFLYDLIVNREVLYSEYMNLSFKITNPSLIQGVLYLKTESPEEERELFKMITDSCGKRATIYYFPTVKTINNFYQHIFKLNKYVNISIKSQLGGIPYSKKIMDNKEHIENHDRMIFEFYQSMIPKKIQLFTDIDLYFLYENPKLKEYLDSIIYGFSLVAYNGDSTNLVNTKVIKRKIELKKLITNPKTLIRETIVGIFPSDFQYHFNIKSISDEFRISYKKIVKDKLYYHYSDDLNILILVPSLNRTSNNDVIEYLLEEIYKEYGLDEVVNFLKQLSSNIFSSYVKLNYLFVKNIDEELINNPNILRLLKPHLHFKLDTLRGKYIYSDFLNLSEEQIKILDFIVLNEYTKIE